MKILILLLLTHEFQIVHNNILTVKSLTDSSSQPRYLNDQAYTKAQLNDCKNMPGDNITNFEGCSSILRHEYFLSGNHTKPRAYQMIREKDSMFVILCEQLQICPEIDHYLTYEECRRLQRNQNTNDVKQRIWLKVYKKCEQKIYPHQFQMCEQNLRGPVAFHQGMEFYNQYCRFLYHTYQKVNNLTCGKEYPLNRHYIKYEYSNCLHLLGAANLLNSASCLANDFMYKFYKVPCRKEVTAEGDEFKKQCEDNIGFANIYKRSIKEYLEFKHIQCGEGEKHLMGHCHRKTKFMIDVMSWIAVITVAIVGTGVLTKLLKNFFQSGTHDRRKLLQINYNPQSATGLLAKLAMNYDSVKIFNKKNKRKLLSFLKLDSSTQNRKRKHFARVLKEHDLNKPFSDFDINDTEKFLQIAAVNFIGLDKKVLKTLTPKVLRTVHKVFKKIRL